MVSQGLSLRHLAIQAVLVVFSTKSPVAAGMLSGSWVQDPARGVSDTIKVPLGQPVHTQ